MLKAFVQRPQSLAFRRVLFQVHLWVGIGVGLYIFVIGITGAAVMFRPEMQEATYPQFFHVASAGEPDAGPMAIIAQLDAAYPNHQLVGIDWPTYRRETVLAYMSKGEELRTVFVHPTTAAVLGELPERSWIRWLQELHFNLLAGRTGLVVNGIGALCLLLMCLTGIIIWWPGVGRWRQSLCVDLGKNWKRIVWELHGATGFWMLAFLMMWAVTGLYFAFPQQFRAVVHSISPSTTVRAPESELSHKGQQPPPAIPALIAKARQLVPGAKLARLVPPATERAAFLVLMAREVHGDFDTSDEVSLYFDQYDGELLRKREQGQRTAGDLVMAWVGPLHVGSFGGRGVKILWALFALSFPLLFVTGTLIWWNRVLSDKWTKVTRKSTGPVDRSALTAKG